MARFDGSGATPDEPNLTYTVASEVSPLSVEMYVHQFSNTGITLGTRELSARLGQGNFRTKPLLKPSLEWQGKVRSAGIVTCTALGLLDSTLNLLKHLKQLGCSLPIEAWHVGELGPSNTSRLTAFKTVQVRDLLTVISTDVASDPADVDTFRGRMCKPLAVIASNVDEVMLIDHDAT